MNKGREGKRALWRKATCGARVMILTVKEKDEKQLYAEKLRAPEKKLSRSARGGGTGNKGKEGKRALWRKAVCGARVMILTVKEKDEKQLYAEKLRAPEEKLSRSARGRGTGNKGKEGERALWRKKICSARE